MPSSLARSLVTPCLGAAASFASAQTLSWTTDAASSANSASTSVHGMEFTVTQSMLVTHLGVYDDTFLSADGLASSKPVAIYIKSSQLQIASAVVPSGVGSIKLNQFRIVALANPVTLAPSTTYVLASVTGGDPTRNVTKDTSSFVTIPEVSVGNWVFTGGAATLSMPTTVASTTNVRLGPVMALTAPVSGQAAWSIGITPGNASSGSASVTGQEFRVTRPVRVSAIGVYDDTFASAAGLASAVPIAIYDAQTQQLVTSLTVPSGTGALLRSRFRYVNAAPGVLLSPARQYVIASLQGPDATTIVAPGDFSVEPRVRLIAWRTGGSTLAFPDTVLPTPNFSFGPNLLLQDACAVDIDASGSPSLDDIFIFLNLWFANDPAADFDGVDGRTLDDLFIFISAWFIGC